MASHFFGINDRVFEFSHTIGANSTRGRGFRSPTDVAVGRNGVLYVVNRSFEEAGVASLLGVKVAMLTMDEEYRGEFGSHGEGDGQFVWPTCVALDSQDNVCVSDYWLNRISTFNQEGKFLRKWGTPGSQGGQLNHPLGLAFDGDDNLYVVDGDNHRVQLFTKDGKFLNSFGSFGAGEGQFNLPWGIDVDRNGEVYVADWRNDRVQVFDKNGRFQEKFGSSGDLVGQFNRPTDVAVDRDGDIYVVDWGNHRVQVFTPEYRFVTAFLGDANMSKWGQQIMDSNPPLAQMLGLIRDWTPFQRFRYPIAVDTDSEGRVIIVDGTCQRLQIYTKEKVGVAV